MKSTQRLFIPNVLRDPAKVAALFRARRKGTAVRDIADASGVKKTTCATALARCRRIVEAGEAGIGKRGYTAKELELAQAICAEWARYSARGSADRSMTDGEVDRVLAVLRMGDTPAGRAGGPPKPKYDGRKRSQGRQPKFNQAECDAIITEFRRGGSTVEQIADDYGCKPELIHRVLDGKYRTRKDP